MILNYDCLRDVLLVLEKNLTFDDDLAFVDLNLDKLFTFDSLSKYTKEDIYYCVYNLLEIGFVDGTLKLADGGMPYHCDISNITYEGHEFLQSIKSDTVWENIKSKLKPIAGLSIPLITEVAKTLILSSLGIQ